MFSRFFKTLFRSKKAKADTLCPDVQYFAGAGEGEYIVRNNVLKLLTAELREHFYNNKTITHKTAQAAMYLFFKVDFPDTLWRIRYAKESLLYFKVVCLQPVFKKDKLIRLCVLMRDDSLGTELMLQVPAEDLWDVMEPVPPINRSALQRQSQSNR